MKVRIAVPVHKKTLSKNETRSLEQCFKVLGHYSISIVTHEELDTSIYSAIAKKMNVTVGFECFDRSFFKDAASYNRMLLSREFYLRFCDDDYLLIYQADGFVFKDELKDWCDKGFDYIGAPWLIHYGRGKYAKSNKLYKVGNGGVSLRRISAFSERFDKRMPVSVFPFYVKNIRKKRLFSMTIQTLKILVLLIFTRRSVEYYLQHWTDEVVTEDCFWADGLSNTKIALKVPNVTTAANFCFEIAPSYLYRLTGNKLPFACHAYEKYEYEEFWKKHIRH